MRIDASNGLPESQQAERSGSMTPKARLDKAPATTPNDDSSTLSATAQKVGGLKRDLQTSPEVRRERVQALQKAIAAGTYQVSDQQIATAMFSELLAPTLGRG